MALEQLLAALEREGRAKAAAEIEAARLEARRIAAESEERLARRREDALAALEAELRGEAERLISAERRAARRRVLEARQRMLDRVFHAAEERLAEISTSEAYAARLGDQLSEAISYLATPAAVVRCPPALASRVRALIAGQDRLSVEEEEKAEPGFVLLAADGSLEVEGTLTARLTRLRPFLGIEILDRVGADA